MSEYTSGYGERADEDTERDPLAPVTRGREFLEEHHWPEPVPDGSKVREELGRLADRVIILDNLPEHAEVDPDLRAAVSPYILPSRLDLPTPAELLERIQSTTDRPPES